MPANSFQRPGGADRVGRTTRNNDQANRLMAMLQDPSESAALTWLGIALCVVQTGLFSGLNLAVFSISRLRLEVEAAGGNPFAVKLLELRKDANLTLATILWGNVATTVLLTRVRS